MNANGDRYGSDADRPAGLHPRRTAIARLTAGAAILALGGLTEGRGGLAAAQSATPPAGASAYTVLRRYQLAAGASAEELARRVDEGFVPIISKFPGFQEYVLVDFGDGVYSLGIYDDPSAAEQSTAAAADWVAENVAQFMAGPPEVTSGWVRIHTTA